MRRAAVIASVCCAFLLGGCSGVSFTKAQNADAPRRVRAAATRTLASATAAITGTMDLERPGLTTDASDRSRWDGIVDLRNGNAKLGLQLTSSRPAQRVIRVNFVEYFQFTPSRWEAHDTSGESPNLMLTDLTRTNEFVALLAGIDDDVRVVGFERVGGSATTHFSGTISATRAATTMRDGDVGYELRTLANALGHERIPVDVWIDGAGRARRLKLHLDATPAFGLSWYQTTATLDLAIDLSDFGIPLAAQAPANFNDESSPNGDRAVQHDLTDALRREQAGYSPAHGYPSVTEPNGVNSTTLTAIGDRAHAGDHQVVCIWGFARSGFIFSIAEIANRAPVYRSNVPCPQQPTAAVSAFGTNWIPTDTGRGP